MRAKKIKEKLSLSNEHISIIKNLLSRDGYNDQMVQAIFSQLGRTINHREIGYIRTNRLRYAQSLPRATTSLIHCLWAIGGQQFS